MPHKKVVKKTPLKKRIEQTKKMKSQNSERTNPLHRNSTVGIDSQSSLQIENQDGQVPSLNSELRNGVLEVTFRDHTNGNSFSLETAQLLEKIIRENQSSCRALLFKSNYRIFCSGGNLKNYARMKTALEGRQVNSEIQRILNYIYLIQFPTAVVVDGDCWGGGLELLSCFDLVVATPHVFFGLWQRRNGLTTGWGGGERLQGRISKSAFQLLAISTNQINAYEAQAMGLVDELAFNKFFAEKRARQWLDSATKGPQQPIGSIKKMTNTNEAKLFEKHWWSQEHQAILQSRKK